MIHPILRTMMVSVLMMSLGSSAFAASRTEIDARVRAAIDRMYLEHPASRELAGRSVGMLVFPRVIKAGFILGGESGEGALVLDGTPVDYYRASAVSLGLQIGGQAKTEIVMFMNNDVLQQFRQSRGWEAGVDGNIAIAEFGAGKTVNTHSARDPIIAFVFDNRGLMYDLSIEGTKFSRIRR